ncbi:hypothetical protein [Streptomyces sp. MJM8645]|uniref:hypothetical protein n=1 Tax=Streptomycetaceae TaxID=2062 RepID=UPI0007AF3845|nr:hypothetical protein [Streptomyces sp. MJM8645]
MTTTTDTPRPLALLGRRLSDWADPKNTIVAVSLAIGCGLYGWPGLGWAAIAIAFAAVIPMIYIVYIEGNGTWADRHLTDRVRRITVLPVISGSVAAGLALQAATSAPRPLIAMTAAMWATITAVWPITVLAKYKISVHAAVTAGSFAMLAQAYNPWWLLGFVFVALLGWARVTVREHTVSQTITGAVLGTIVAGGVYMLIA